MNESVQASLRLRLWQDSRLVHAGLALLLVIVFVISLGIGAMPIAPASVMQVLFGLSGDDQAQTIIWGLRLPRSLLAITVGAGLGLAGAALQGLFRNPLADPGLIGISGGAALAAVGVIVLGHLIALVLPMASHSLFLPLAAFLGGLAATFATDRIAHFRSATSTTMLLLAGIAINSIAGALMGFLFYVSDDQQLRDATFWSMGSLAKGGWAGVMMTAPAVLIAAYFIFRSTRALDAILLGEREALHLGICVTRLKNTVLISAALAVGAGVAVCGMIAFIGMVVPHLVRLAVGPRHECVLPGSALLGATMLLLADSIARVAIAPAELPVGLVTSLIGSPFFLFLLLTRTGPRS